MPLKKSIRMILVLSFIVGMPLVSHGEPLEAPMKVIINQELQDYEVLLSQGRIMVPMRGVFERLGAQVEWNAQTRTAAAQKDQLKILLTLEQQTATVSGKTVYLDAPATLHNGRTFVPLRFVSESLGADVRWDAASRTAYIQTGALDQWKNKELKGLTVGMDKATAEGVIGKAVASYTGPGETWWSTYHSEYKSMYVIAYKDNKIHFIYTSNPEDSFAGYSPGDSSEGLATQVTYESGSYRAVFTAAQDERLVLKDDEIGVFYLDQHDGNRISAVRVISPRALLGDTVLLNYRISFSNRSDIPAAVPFSPAAGLREVENGQSAIHFELDNGARVSHGLSVFRWHASLAEVARLHSADMAANKFFDHISLDGLSPFDRMKNAGISYKMAAENISWGEGYSDAIASHHGLMNSLGHRKNILNPELTELGVGASYIGGLYFTQNFIQ